MQRVGCRALGVGCGVRLGCRYVVCGVDCGVLSVGCVYMFLMCSIFYFLDLFEDIYSNSSKKAR